MESGVVMKGSLDWEEKGPESGKGGEGWRERKGRVRREGVGNQDVVVAQGPGRGGCKLFGFVKGSGTLLVKAPCNP